ncbi:MAG: hypothetical protein HY719_06755 [Planctomycetes bacterium]|nr:hypothetical protein [Planctomycetota bacterium]
MPTPNDKVPGWLVFLGAVAAGLGGMAIAAMLAESLSDVHQCPRCLAAVRRGQQRCPRRECRARLQWR